MGCGLGLMPSFHFFLKKKKNITVFLVLELGQEGLIGICFSASKHAIHFIT